MRFVALVFGKNLRDIESIMQRNGRTFDLSLQDWIYSWDSYEVTDCTGNLDFDKETDFQAIIFDDVFYRMTDYSEGNWAKIVDSAFKFQQEEEFSYERIGVCLCHR